MAASAAPNTAIIVGEVTLAPADAQLTIGDTVTVSGSWDATAADPQPGDTFTIGLPKEFRFPQAIPFQLLGDGDVWGNCLTDPATGVATCTLTSAVTERPELVQGTWEFEIEAIAATTATEVAFDLNGTEVFVPLPGGAGIDDGIELPGEMTKRGVMNANNWSMTWTLELPGANMAGQPTINLTDTFGAGHVLCDPIGLKVHTVRGDDVRDVTAIAALDGAPGDSGFGLVLTAPTGGFDPNVTYRVTYQTCTPDGQIDPAGTTYENSAAVEGWGDAGTGVGTVTSGRWHEKLTKSGSVLGGADRNGRIAWTVTVPGDQLVDKNGFTFSEKLGVGHHVGDDTISGIRIVEQYGPSGDKRTPIDDRLAVTVLTEEAQEFSLRFDVRDGADFAFKASDYRYVVTYRTEVTDAGLPAAGTQYANDVTVDGQVASSTATVPNRAQGKSGKINGSIVTVDGVEHMPQTTMNWSVTIPGEKIDGLAEIDLTDTLSATQVICPAGDPTGGPLARLALTVQADDQISGGGLSRVVLTDRTRVSLDGQRIGFSVAAPEGETFSREYQYRFSYTTCTTSGGMDAPGTVYGNSLEGEGIKFTSSMTQSNRGSGTGTGVTRGSVSVSKSLTENAAAKLVPAGTKFTVMVQEIDPTGTAQGEPYSLQVPLDGDPVNGLNARGNGWTAVLSEPRFPAVPGIVWGKPAFQASTGVTPSADGTTAVAALTPGSNIAVSLQNEALLGSAAVTKKVTGPAAALDLVDRERTYEVTAKIDTSGLGDGFPAQPDRVIHIADGVVETLDDLPIGAVVTFSETRPADGDVLTWSTPEISPATLTITAAHATDPAEVTVTNRVERTVGTFSIVKSVTGEQRNNAAVPDHVTVTASWQQDGADAQKTLAVPTDGTAVPLGENLLIGTEVTLTETPLVDGSRIAWAAPVWSGTGVALDGDSAVVSITRDAQARVLLENHAATSVAGISLIKGIAGAAAGEVPDDAEFPVTATWMDDEGDTHSRELTINALEPTPLGVDLPAGTVVTLTEGDRPDIDTVVWGSITLSGERVTQTGGASAEVVVSDQQDDVTLVTVVNEASWAPGTFTLSKQIEGILLDNADVPETVIVSASWLDGTEVVSTAIELPTDGSAVAFGQELPHGTSVSLSELPSDEGAAFTWNTPAWAGDDIEAQADGTAVLTIGAAKRAEVVVTNSVTEKLGVLEVTKTVTGTGAGLVADVAFPVTASWTDLLGERHEVAIEVSAGEPATIDGVPMGTAVTLTENDAETPAKARWIGATWSTDDEMVSIDDAGGDAITIVVTGDAGTTASIDLSNEFEKLPDLAVTGGVLTQAFVVVMAVLLIGLGVALMLRRRREA